jgi:archaellum biogenesis protein FlaJ (TadC family)
MNLKLLSRGEWIAMAGGLVLAAGVFIKWYESTSAENGELAGVQGLSTASAWDAHPILRWLLLAAAISPFILAYIIAADKELSWPRGQVTSVVAIAALGLMLYAGIISRPGEPKSAIELEWGWYVAMAGAVLMLIGSVMRQSETEVKRKPPGTI